MNEEQQKVQLGLNILLNKERGFEKIRDRVIARLADLGEEISLTKVLLHFAQFPIYDVDELGHRALLGRFRRVVDVDQLYVTIRSDRGYVMQFRRSDGKEKFTHRRKSRGRKIDIERALILWNYYCGERIAAYDAEQAAKKKQLATA